MQTAATTIDPADETAWAGIRSQFEVADGFVNLENGYFGTQAKPVLAAFEGYNRLVNAETSHFYRRLYPERHADVLRRLAEFTGTSDGELLITRNTTEAMNILIQGYPFTAGDRIVLGSHDYDSVVATFEMVAARKGLGIDRVRLPLHPDSDEEIVGLYERAITPRTRVLLLTHMIHTTGQILPVARIAAMARGHGVDVMVDAAHSFAHIDWRFPDLGADFVAVNLHKWLGAPLGVGLLHIRRERIAEIAPLYGDVTFPADDIRRLGHFGTTPAGPVLAIADALAFHHGVGSANKEARLRLLTRRWMEAAAGLDRIELLTPQAPERSCAIAAFRVTDMPAKAVVEHLFERHRIFTVERVIDGGTGVRVTPHLYTSLSDIDRLIGALGDLAA
ncbi:aminotransferase class V-fold PLP-dependent enzyme [Azospirillum sp.]|uniref:aminotransferase class V-fold PLP-dependent enzyme n=1 Tax=Azospirillum sp. TaxID=34012 RepID=UPI003D733EC6